MIDNGDVDEMKRTLKLFKREDAEIKMSMSLLKVSAKFGVHIILRKPLIFQDLR